MLTWRALAISLLGSSLALAAPSNITKRSSGKLGISWPIQEGSAAPVVKFFGAGSAVTWWFNWNKNFGTKLFPADAAKPQINGNFVPMYRLDNALEAGWTSVMGFNEPDLHSSTGVSVALGAADAATKWRALVGEARAQNPNVKLISPAVAGDKNWLVGFFNAICPGGLPGCTWAPDYLSIHVYATSLQSFQDKVNAYHAQFGLDVIVSEYACYSWDGSNPQITPGQASEFMRSTTAWMDGVPWINKYAWFGAVRNAAWLFSVAPGNRLMDAGGELTAL